MSDYHVFGIVCQANELGYSYSVQNQHGKQYGFTDTLDAAVLLLETLRSAQDRAIAREASPSVDRSSPRA